MDLKSWEIENPSSPKLGPKSSKIELKMFKWAIFFFSVLWYHSTTFTALFSKCWGTFLRVPCRALKLQKMDSPCNFVQEWLFLGTFKDFFYTSFLKSCVSRVRTSKNENRSPKGNTTRINKKAALLNNNFPYWILKSNKILDHFTALKENFHLAPI